MDKKVKKVEMVDASAVRKRSRSPGLSVADNYASALSLKKGTKKGVRKFGAGTYPRRSLARKLVPRLQQLNPVLLVLVNYEA